MSHREDETVEFTPSPSDKSQGDQKSNLQIPIFKGYKIEGELGRGGLGVVYRGIDLTLNRPVAIKVLRADEGTVDQRNQILNEARKAAALDDRCIVTVYGVIESESHSAIVMELIDGHELQNVSAVLEPKQIAKIVSEVTRALKAAHQAGILHRDIKPQNVIVTPAHEVKILDFGLSIHISDKAESGSFSGTVSYASPEILQGGPPTTQSDIYSLGVLMHETLTGRHPFSKLGKPPTVSSILAGDPTLPREIKPQIPPDLEKVVLACLSFKPTNRPSADEVYQALLQILIDKPVELKAGKVQDHVLNRIEEHVATIEKWFDLGMIEGQSRDALRSNYRKVLEGDDTWPTETRKIQAGEIGLYLCVWLAVVTAALSGIFYRKEVSEVFSWTLPLFITTTLGLSSYLVQYTTQQRIRPLFASGFILSLVPTLISILSNFVWNPNVYSKIELFGKHGIANKTMFTAGILSLIVSVIRLNQTGFSFYAWVSATLLAFSHGSLLLMLGFLEWSAAAQSLGILSMSISWLSGLAFESMNKPRFARPFHWTGSLSLIIGLFLFGMSPALKWLGLSTGITLIDKGWSLALCGMVLLLSSTILSQDFRLERRRIALIHEWMNPFFIIGGLGMAANHAIPRGDNDISSIGILSLLFLVASIAIYVTLTSLNWRARYMLAALSGSAFFIQLIPEFHFYQTQTYLGGCAVISLAIAIFSYIKMELSGKQKVSKKTKAVRLRDD